MTKEQFTALKIGDYVIADDFEARHTYRVTSIKGEYIYTHTGHEYHYSDLRVIS